MAEVVDKDFKYCYYSWYFGPLDRTETKDILEHENVGVFLVRQSSRKPGDFVLCVREDEKIKNYIIETIVNGGSTSFKIGDQEFPELPSLIEYYQIHYLDSTSLIRPVPRKRVLAQYNFPGEAAEDLAFKKGEYLKVISKDKSEWWIAENSQGDIGRIPVNYVELESSQPSVLVVNNRQSTESLRQNSELNRKSTESLKQNAELNRISTESLRRNSEPQCNPLFKNVKLPAKAIAIKSRSPNIYDKNQLKLEVDDSVIVTQMNPTGQWVGEVNGKTGIFPFTYIRMLTQEELQQ